ncbi:DUF4114 domain-containing protein [Vulgatibacter incomptus]|uniref:DUF4114 domain-containing protein n=1 Tax=Vulgatibacter incomptus TaxID=1391653 RepID=A0A0K1PHU4_9BACT|nr:DUF4114 domain-containing protein [Vulgatibacter incomptus]AKU93095.1 hypothetical protein AKJ08_3482 [Vulgatibacter incomptus]
MKSTTLRSVLIGLALSAAAHASALTQPGETAPIPDGFNLLDFLVGEGEPFAGASKAEKLLDLQSRVATTPQRFNPNCSLTFKVIGRGAGQHNSFGWYNITGSRPEPGDLHEFLSCDDGVGTLKTLDIAADPAYRGGEIGFFMATTQKRNADGTPGSGLMTGNCVKFDPTGPRDSTLGFLYFSEPQWNDDNKGANSFIHLLILDSGVYDQAFYFGWEDLHSGGDNDFEDILTRVEGITCSGGGADCDTGLPGVCGAGTMQCRNGRLACAPQVKAKAVELCNGLDDDCDGVIDNDAICPDGQICHRGACVAKCFPGEFGCFGGTVCDDGVCVEPACAGVRCTDGAICVDGECKAPCDGVTCPMGHVCRVGACVDPCQGVECDAGQVCDAGVCKDACGCAPCPDGTVCAADGRCAAVDCAGVECASGFVCRGGECIDACAGAVCPGGEACVAGACVPMSGTGGSGGSTGTGGSGQGGTGGSSGSGAGGSGGGGPGAGGSGSAADGAKDSSSCGCSAGESGAGLGLLALALLRRRPAVARVRR